MRQHNVTTADFERGPTKIGGGRFEMSSHYYPRAINAQIHPLVRFFLGLSTDRIVQRYCHLNPRVRSDSLKTILSTKPRFFRWGGADLFHVTSEDGRRRMVIIETNSCPSGNKSMPLRDEEDEMGSYRKLMADSFLPAMRRKSLGKGVLAVLFDKNLMETSGYAHALAEESGEPVWLVPYKDDAHAKWTESGTLMIKTSEGELPVRAAFRYVTQKPWNRIPVATKTMIYNPILVCLAGGRNKMLASKAYEFFNAEIAPHGLEIHTPDTIRDISREEVSLWIDTFGGHAVVKVPYSNAGQGVYTITSQQEYEEFMSASSQDYDDYIVQALIGNQNWSSLGRNGRLYHVGTMPDKTGNTYVADMRMMCYWSNKGFRPLSMYARRARQPLSRSLVGSSSWDVLGTNLSVKSENGWETETNRLVLMDNRDFNALGVGLDELIAAFVQTVLSIHAIDRMAARLLSPKKRLKKKLFRSLNPDEKLIREIV